MNVDEKPIHMKMGGKSDIEADADSHTFLPAQKEESGGWVSAAGGGGGGVSAAGGGGRSGER